MSGAADVPRAAHDAGRPAGGATHEDRPAGGANDQPLDLRLVAVALGAWLGCQAGMFLGPRVPARGPAGLAVLLPVLAAVVWRTNRPRARTLSLAALAFVVGALSATLRLLPLDAHSLHRLVEEGAAFRAEVVLRTDPVTRAGVVVGDRRGPAVTEATADLLMLTARGDTYLMRIPVLVRGDDGLAGVPPGTKLAVTGVLRSPGPRLGVAAVLSLRDRPVVEQRAGPVWRGTTRLRAGLTHAVTGLAPDVRGLLPGLVVGDVSGAAPELVVDMRTTGLTHLVAVSGANTALVLAAVLALTRLLRLRRFSRAIVALLALGGFVALVRPQPSVSRAAVMGVVAVLALTVGGRRRAVPALSAAVLTLVLVDPWLAVTYGFALSVCATAGLVLLGPYLGRALRRRFPRAPNGLVDALAVSMAAQLATAPLIASLAGYVSAASLPANLLAAPAVGPATVLGVLATLAAPVAPWAAWLLVRAAAVPTAWIALVAHTLARPGWATFGWPSGLKGALALVVVIVGVWTGFRLLDPRRRLRVVVALVLVLALVRLGVARLADLGWPPSGWVMVACDVGQGDALVLNDGPGRAVVVDTGPDPRSIDRCLTRLRIREVTTLVLTHFHADHVGGLGGVLHRRKVESVLTSPYPDPLAEALLVRTRLLLARVPQRAVAAGASLQSQQLRAEVLWPPLPGAPGSQLTTAGPNDESVVLLVTCTASRPVRVLLTSDVGEVPQAALEASAALPDEVDVIKVPHHGSAYQAAGFAARAGGALAVVSVGAGNPYGHPVTATLQRYRAEAGAVLRTDASGDIGIVVDATGRLAYVTSR